ncbi:MAG: RluA family pseudouridine synthase, partial [bacterium]|nr:RluA family pseudouridine synthase [bacterium]
GFVSVNGQSQIKTSYKVCVDDKLTIEFPAMKPTELTPHEVDFEILYEDKDLLVLNKPANLIVHPGAGNYETSLVHGLLHHCKDLSGIGGVERPGIVHRLDKGTSGVMVVAKHDRAHQILSEQFKNHEVEKKYWALCLGSVSSPKQTLRTLIKRSETNRKKFIVNLKRGKEAVSHISILRKNERVTLTEIKIDTGRTHQIRVHMSHLGHSILGDEVYGGTKKLANFNEEEKQYIRDLGHPLLHAKKLSFTHPISGDRKSFETDLPIDFNKALKKFGL